ncbi:MAG: acyloxyacyl hydrolase [Alphaproteobacteria bacterium]
MNTVVDSRRARFALLSLTLALLLAPGVRATAQNAPLPPEVGAAIDEAIRAGEIAGRNAALSTGIVNNPARDEIARRTLMRVQEASLASAVVGGIRQHPEAVATIVRAAIERAPAHRVAIVYRASFAFPGFARVIRAAAGFAPSGALAPPPGDTITPVATGPPRAPAAKSPVIHPPDRAGFAAAKTPALPAVRPAAFKVAQAAAPEPAQSRNPVGANRATRTAPFGLSELRIGVAHHDTGVFGAHEEDGADVILEARFSPFTWSFFDRIGRPRPHVGANVNTVGDTSSFYAGLTWGWTFWRAMFFSLDLGGALHDGKLETRKLDRKELGSRALFREAIELGYVFAGRHAVALRVDHISNAGLADQNEGLDTVGAVYGYRF